jgi:hypothetical protein
VFAKGAHKVPAIENTVEIINKKKEASLSADVISSRLLV